MAAFHTGEQMILVVGHSLGGAIALLVAEWLRRKYGENLQLYTFGAPRTGDATFVREAKDLTHHRMVNHNDPIPGVPFTWMDAEWKTLAPSAVLAASGSLNILGISAVLASLVNLKGDPYEHHGEQRHFIPRKPGAGSEAKILWQPGCATLEQLICAYYATELQLRGDMPERVSFGETVMSIMKHFGDHSSHTGYARAALANLLRWRSSVMDRNGALFTYKESEHLVDQVRDIEARMKAWVPGNFADFYARRHTDPRMAGKTQLELQAAFTEARAQVVALANTEIKELKRTRKRLQAQAEQPITPKDVFGDQAERADLDELLNQWLALSDIQKAARLAKVSLDETRKFA
jgi:pimeloyl-ACP methyl ester carboxylesterase